MKMTNKLGVMVDCFRLPLLEGLRKAKELGADGVQVYAGTGDMDPVKLSAAKRTALRGEVETLGLEVSALCGDLGGHGLQDKEENPQKVEQTKRIIGLAADLGCNVVTSHIGVVPCQQDWVYEAMYNACREIGEFAQRHGAYFAIETGPEPATHLKSFLDTLGTKGVAVNFDPANLVMIPGDDPAMGVKALGSYIVHTHVKDGIRHRPIDPRVAYGMLGFEPKGQEQVLELLAEGKVFEEVALGEGQVDFDAYFAALQAVGYTGYLTVEREVGDNPEKDIRHAVEFINRYR